MVSLPVKLSVAIAVAVFVSMALLGIFTMEQARQSIQEVYTDKAATTARAFDAVIVHHGKLGNRDEIFELIQRHLWLETDIERIVMHRYERSGDLRVYVSSDGRDLGKTSSDFVRRAFTENRTLSAELNGNMGPYLDLVAPMHLAQRIVGVVEVRFSMMGIAGRFANIQKILTVAYMVVALLLMLIVIWVLRRMMIEPLLYISNALKSVAQGHYAERVNLNNKDELGTLARAFNAMAADVEVAQQEVKRLAFFDELTGLPNRRQFLLDLERRRSESDNPAEGQCDILLYIDIDRFKFVNDTYGHVGGDHLLMELATRIMRILHEGDAAARIGGDEFVVLLSEVESSTQDSIQQRVEEVGDVLSKPYKINDRYLDVTVSIGVRSFDMQESDPEELLSQADFSMYESKRAGRNQISYFTPALSDRHERTNRIWHDLPGAIDRDEMSLHFQPILDAGGGLAALESLARWHHPELGMVSPVEFIPIAEERAVITELGDWIIGCALKEYMALRHRSMLSEQTRISINVSPRQLLLEAFSNQVKHAMEQHQIPSGLLELELTEQSFLRDPELAVARMNELKHSGVVFSLDDFGTGYSSLSYLKRLPLKRLKIDRYFVRDIVTDENDAAIVDTIIGIAQHYQLEVVAEGVETRAQYQLLEKMGCQYYQGFYFSEPLSLDELVEFLNRQSEQTSG